MKTVYFLRHGESEANVQGVYAGVEIDTPLTKRGREQATAAGLKLRDKDIQLIVCSPLQRTVDTAKLIAEAIGCDPEKIVTNMLFIERSFGEASGKPHELYEEKIAQNEPVPGIESTEAMHTRVSQGLAWLKRRPEDQIVLVSHGGISRSVRAIDQALDHSQMYQLERMDNATLYEFHL